MKLGAGLFALAGVLAMGFSPSVQSEPWTVLISGQFEGNLSPCGCTKPMSGGLRRLVTAVRPLKDPTSLHIQMGPWIAGVGRQDVLKAQTLAQAVALSAVDVVGLSQNEAKLGGGELEQLSRLSGGRLLSPLNPTREIRDTSIHWVTTAPEVWSQSIGTEVEPPDTSIREFMEGSTGHSKRLLLLDGSESDAHQLARKFPELTMIVFRSGSRPSNQVLREGKTILATAGEHGKFLVRATIEGLNALTQTIELGPQYKDESRAQELYRQYLARVSREQLLEKLPRESGRAFSGTAKCGSCHQQALKVWRTSAHAHALPTLARTGNDRDPECLPCHVVGLSSNAGFTSPSATPNLAAVGCESCHGAGAKHSASPKKYGIAKSDASTCAKCHSLMTSPEFNFLTYWAKVRHR